MHHEPNGIADALNVEGWRLVKWAEEEQEKMVRAERWQRDDSGAGVEVASAGSQAMC